MYNSEEGNSSLERAQEESTWNASLRSQCILAFADSEVLEIQKKRVKTVTSALCILISRSRHLLHFRNDFLTVVMSAWRVPCVIDLICRGQMCPGAQKSPPES